MRTQAQLHKDLAGVNVQDIARLAGVSAKTLYRIRQSAEYTTSVKTAEAISRALDIADSRPSAMSAPKRNRKQEA